MKTKKRSSYKRMGLIMLLAAIGGGALGLLLSIILGDGRIDDIESGASFVLAGFQQIMVPVMAVIAVVSVVYGELNLRKQRMVCGKILETEDEECDFWEYEEEKAGAYGTVANILSQVLSVLVLSAGYSIKYIWDGNHGRMLVVCLIFMACYIYEGFWQARFVKLIQTTHPEKKGDPSSMKFQQQWLESCDEAERELIYRSAFKSYHWISKAIPVMLVITMLGHLFFNTGLMAIATVAVIWMVHTVSYLRTCVDLKGKKIRE